MDDETLESGGLEISGTLEKRDVTWHGIESAFSLYNVLYYTVVFTLFGWIIAFLVEEGDGLAAHFGRIILLAFLFSILQCGLALYSFFNEWSKISQPACLYRIGDGSLQVVTDEFESDIAWKYITGAKESRRDFTLFIPGDQQPPIMIPKRFFRNEYEIKLFRDILDENKLLDQGGSSNA